VISSSSISVYSNNYIGYPKISHGIENLFNVENYFTNANLLLNNFVLSIAPESNTGNDLLPKINGSNTFFSKGLLSSVLFPHYDVLENEVNGSSNLFDFNNSQNDGDDNMKTSLFEFPKLVSGDWVLNVSQGNVTYFHSLFKVVTSDGLEKHFVELINFQNQNTSVILSPYSSTVINGYIDMKIDDQLFDTNLPLEIKLNKINTIALSMDNQSISDFFFNNQIQGIVDSFRNFEGVELLVFDS
jgi:hypothetical protein